MRKTIPVLADSVAQMIIGPSNLRPEKFVSRGLFHLFQQRDTILGHIRETQSVASDTLPTIEDVVEKMAGASKTIAAAALLSMLHHKHHTTANMMRVMESFEARGASAAHEFLIGNQKILNYDAALSLKEPLCFYGGEFARFARTGKNLLPDYDIRKNVTQLIQNFSLALQYGQSRNSAMEPPSKRQKCLQSSLYSIPGKISFFWPLKGLFSTKRLVVPVLDDSHHGMIPLDAPHSNVQVRQESLINSSSINPNSVVPTISDTEVPEPGTAITVTPLSVCEKPIHSPIYLSSMPYYDLACEKPDFTVEDGILLLARSGSSDATDQISAFLESISEPTHYTQEFRPKLTAPLSTSEMDVTPHCTQQCCSRFTPQACKKERWQTLNDAGCMSFLDDVAAIEEETASVASTSMYMSDDGLQLEPPTDRSSISKANREQEPWGWDNWEFLLHVVNVRIVCHVFPEFSDMLKEFPYHLLPDNAYSSLCRI